LWWVPKFPYFWHPSRTFFPTKFPLIISFWYLPYPVLLHFSSSYESFPICNFYAILIYFLRNVLRSCNNIATQEQLQWFCYNRFISLWYLQPVTMAAIPLYCYDFENNSTHMSLIPVIIVATPSMKMFIQFQIWHHCYNSNYDTVVAIPNMTPLLEFRLQRRYWTPSRNFYSTVVKNVYGIQGNNPRI